MMKTIFKTWVLVLSVVLLTAFYGINQYVVFFNSLDDLPTPIGTEILLEDKYYIWTGSSAMYLCDTPTNPGTCTTHYSLVFPADSDSGIIGVHILNAPLVYVGGGTFLKGVDIDSIRLQNITFSAPYGTLFDITGNDRLNAFLRAIDVVTSNVANLGRLDTISLLSNNVQFDDFGQGLIGDSVRFTSTSLSFSNPKDVTKDTPCSFTNATNIVNSTAHWMYDNDIVRLKTDGTLPAGLSAGFSDLNGAVIDNTDGTVRFTTTAVHGLSMGDTIIPRGTTNYDNTYIVQAVPTTTTFDVIAPFVAETFVNNVAQLGYYVVNKTTDAFQLSRTEGGTVEPFTTDGTGNHEFFENSIGITMRGSLHSFTFIRPVFTGTGKDYTSWDLEPTVSGILSRGSMIGAAYDTGEYFNQFTGSSFNQAYIHYSFSETRLGFNSKQTGVVYSTGNATPTPLTVNIISEVTQGTFDAYNLERTERSSNRLCNTNPNPTKEKVMALITVKSGSPTAKAIKLHMLLNGEDITVAEPIADVLNRLTTMVDVEEITWREGDCLSIGIENTEDGTDMIVQESKLLL